MDDIREALLQRDYLYADGAAYRAGVEAALAAVRAAGADRPAASQVEAGAPHREIVLDDPQTAPVITLGR